jgi:N-sulfoglucosamine sulfohydrolase
MNRPNIILIMPHDLGTHLGCYDWDERLSTPNLDRLAKEGVLFNKNFCTAPYCSPSRGSIFSGKYPHTNGLMGLAGGLKWEMDHSTRLLGHLLEDAGYETFLFGLQHITKDPSWCGFEHLHNQSVGCDDVASTVCDFLENRLDEKQPFYAEIGFIEVHRPYQHFDMVTTAESDVTPLPYLTDTPGLRADQCMLYADIQSMDKAVGNIIDTLDAQNYSDNTLVIFTTDHGIAFPRAKATLYDAGINTALIMRHPAGFAGNRTVEEIVSTVDILPTILDVIKSPVPDDLQGRSFLPLLQELPYQSNEFVFAEKNTSPDDIKRCIRNKRYKYIRNFDDGPSIQMPLDISVSLTVDNMGDAHLEPRPRVELYDLEKDPHEQKNLASLPEFADIEQDLSEKLIRWMKETGDQALTGSISRPAGESEVFAEIRAADAMEKRRNRQKHLNAAYRACSL